MHYPMEVTDLVYPSGMRGPIQPVETRAMIALPVSERSQIAEARRVTAALAARLGFDETGAGRVALVVTEAATNLVKHATGGEMLVYELRCGPIGGIEVVALDRGPGMAKLTANLRNGYSTTGSPGTGLGAIGRLSNSFDIHSVPGAGTVLLARLWSKPLPAPRPPSIEVGAVSVPKPGEEVCGDRWAVAHFPGRTLILVADGLGHGPGAAEAALQAVLVFREKASLSPEANVEAIHAALRSTRGAAVAVAEINPAREAMRFAGVGNIGGIVFSATGSRQMVSYNGIAGHNARKIREFSYPWAEDALLILYSDGLTSRLQPGRYPGLTRHHPDLVAATLYRDYARGQDDVTVVVARETAGETPKAEGAR